MGSPFSSTLAGACHWPSPPQASRSAAKVSHGIFGESSTPVPLAAESQLRAALCGRRFGREPGGGSGESHPWRSGRGVCLGRSRQAWAARGNARGRPVPQTLPTGACVPLGFRGPSCARATRPRFALLSRLPARKVLVAPERRGSPEGGLRWAGPLQGLDELAREAEQRECVCRGSAREREAPTREGWVGERLWWRRAE